jgi:serine/threonine protein kinase
VNPYDIKLADGTNIQLQKLVGDGSFCSAYQALIGNDSLIVKTLRVKVAISAEGKQARTALKSEISLLSELSKLSSHVPLVEGQELCHGVNYHIPVIIFRNSSIRTLDLGKILFRNIDQFQSFEGFNVPTFLNNMRSALIAARQLNICHCDIRPPNIVFNPDTAKFILIDWGLAAAPGSLINRQMLGGICYFADGVVNKTTNHVDFDLDLTAAAYVAVLMKLRLLNKGKAQAKRSQPPWYRKDDDEMLQARRADNTEMQNFKEDLEQMV